MAEYQSYAESTKDTPYLALTGEIWGVFCEYLWENWLLYNDPTLLYKSMVYVKNDNKDSKQSTDDVIHACLFHTI